MGGGYEYSVNQYFNGYIAEVIIYDSALNNSDRSFVENYLMTKWNI